MKAFVWWIIFSGIPHVAQLDLDLVHYEGASVLGISFF